jgi:hypothetical protein
MVQEIFGCRGEELHDEDLKVALSLDAKQNWAVDLTIGF